MAQIKKKIIELQSNLTAVYALLSGKNNFALCLLNVNKQHSLYVHKTCILRESTFIFFFGEKHITSNFTRSADSSGVDLTCYLASPRATQTSAIASQEKQGNNKH